MWRIEKETGEQGTGVNTQSLRVRKSKETEEGASLGKGLHRSFGFTLLPDHAHADFRAMLPTCTGPGPWLGPRTRHSKPLAS